MVRPGTGGRRAGAESGTIASAIYGQMTAIAPAR